MKKILLLAGIAILAIAPPVAYSIGKVQCAKSNESSPLKTFYTSMTTYHTRMMDALPDGIVAFIGDSHFQAMPVNFIVPNAINLGIGGDTVQGVIDRLPNYTKLASAKAIVLDIGVNNLSNGDTTETLKGPTQKMLKALPDKPLLWLAVPPIDESKFNATTNEEITVYNTYIKSLCAARSHCHFSEFPPTLVKNGGLTSECHIGDGLHMNGKGYNIWQAKIKTDLETLLK